MVPGLRFTTFLLFFLISQQTFVYSASGTQGAVATAHPLSTEAAVHILENGGNAVDAAIAAQWVLNVVEPQGSGIGGGGFFLFYEAKSGRVFAFDGRERAPKEVTPDLYLDADGGPIPYIPDRVTGGHSVGVPGTLMLLKTVHERFGSEKYSFAELFNPAIQYAEEGFEISPRLAQKIESQRDRLKLFNASRNLLLDEKDRPLESGHVLKQPMLAATFKLIQEKGIDVFYRGEIAEDMVQTVTQSAYRPGRMQLSDLNDYRVYEKEPLHGTYRGFDLYSMGPPSSGGSTLLETLNILEKFSVGQMKRDEEFFHLFSEAQKLAFQNRNLYLGDDAFSDIPLARILSKENASKQAKKIDPEKVLPTQEQINDRESHQTSHISIVDPEGNMVSYTTTIEHIFGSAMMVPGRGFFLNNELSDFEALPKTNDGVLHPNAPEGGKSPRSSMTPTLLLLGGEPYAAVGSPGGSTIIGTVLNVVVNLIDFEMSPDKAVNAPKVLNRDGAMELETELYMNRELKQVLSAKGQPIQLNRFFGNAQIVVKDMVSGEWQGASDLRGEGLSKGVGSGVDT